MPKIPIYTEQIPPEEFRGRGYPGIVPETAARGLAQISDVLWGIQGQFREISDRERRAAQAVKALQLESSLKNDIDALAESYYERRDFDNFETDATSSLQDLREKYRPQIANDRDLSLAFDRAYYQQATSLMRVVRDKKRQVITEQGLGELERAYNQAVQDYSIEPIEENKEIIKKDLEMKIWSLTSRHILTLKQAEDKINTFSKDSQEGTIVRALHSQDPMAMENAILSIDQGKYPDLSAKERAIYRGSLLERVERAKKEQQIEQDKLSIDQGYQSLKRLWKDDYAGMYQQLADPDFLKANNLTPERKHTLEIILSAEQQRQETQKKKLHDDEEQGLWMRLSQGRLTLQDLQGAKYLSPEERDHWWRRVEEKASGVGVKTNPATYMKIREAIDSGGYGKNEILDTIIRASKKDLSEGDVEKLTEKVYKAKDEINDAALKRTRDYFKSQLVPTRGLGIAESPQEWVDYYNAVNALDQRLDTAKKVGKPIEGEEIWQEGQRLLPTFKPSISDKMERMREENKEMIESLRTKKKTESKGLWERIFGSPAPATAGITIGNEPAISHQPTPMPGITRGMKEPYEIGKIYTDAKGQKAKYLGNGQWQLVK